MNWLIIGNIIIDKSCPSHWRSANKIEEILDISSTTSILFTPILWSANAMANLPAKDEV